MDNIMVLMNILSACGHIDMAWLIHGYTGKRLFGDIETCPYCRDIQIDGETEIWTDGDMYTYCRDMEILIG
jgi:hypothetical protein